MIYIIGHSSNDSSSETSQSHYQILIPYIYRYVILYISTNKFWSFSWLENWNFPFISFGLLMNWVGLFFALESWVRSGFCVWIIGICFWSVIGFEFQGFFLFEMVYFHSSISVCKSVDQPTAMADTKSRLSNHLSRNRKTTNWPNCSKIPVCDRSRSAVVDIVILIAVIGAHGFLLFPYVKFVAVEVVKIVGVVVCLVIEEFSVAPIIYAIVWSLIFINFFFFFFIYLSWHFFLIKFELACNVKHI